MDQFLDILWKGGPYALIFALVIAVIVLWKDKIKKEETHAQSVDNSTDRHRERDEKFVELQEKSIATMTQCSTYMQILVNKGAGDNG